MILFLALAAAGLVEADAALNAAYKQLMAQFRAVGAEDAANPGVLPTATLRTAQLAWIKHRDADCALAKAKEACLERLTRERTRTLAAWVKRETSPGAVVKPEEPPCEGGSTAAERDCATKRLDAAETRLAAAVAGRGGVNLAAAQRAWRDFRDKDCLVIPEVAGFSVMSSGGVFIASCRARLTMERATALP